MLNLDNVCKTKFAHLKSVLVDFGYFFSFSGKYRELMLSLMLSLLKSFTSKFFMWWTKHCQASYPIWDRSYLTEKVSGFISQRDLHLLEDTQYWLAHRIFQ